MKNEIVESVGENILTTVVENSNLEGWQVVVVVLGLGLLDLAMTVVNLKGGE